MVANRIRVLHRSIDEQCLGCRHAAALSVAGTLSTPRKEYEAFKGLIQLARQNPGNLDTTFYLYTGWMSAASAGTDFYGVWYDDTPVDPDADLIRNAVTFDWIYDQLLADPDLAGVDLQMIPVGHVLAELDRRMALGQVPGFTGAENLYRDNRHLNNLGWFVASNSILSTLFKINPTGIPTNDAFIVAPGQTVPIEITPALGPLFKTRSGMSRSHNYAGFLAGDLDDDGFVGINDLNLVLGAWNQNVIPGDPDVDPSGDGFVGIEDLNIVLGKVEYWHTAFGTRRIGARTYIVLVLLGAFTFIGIRRRIRPVMPALILSLTPVCISQAQASDSLINQGIATGSPPHRPGGRTC
ncbi:MAG: hypothetical protein R3C45_11770 [Phycisphaerales bacterium]